VIAAAEEQLFHVLNIVKEDQIAAPADIVFETILDQIGPASEMDENTPMPLVLEAWPGGRWYRDLGNNAGHLWGHVQVIKPPKLLEICGPMFMSYAANNHIQYRLVENSEGTLLKLTHTAAGLIPKDHREGVIEGWDHELKLIREKAERRQTANR
jgi:hypothetical protein